MLFYLVNLCKYQLGGLTHLVKRPGIVKAAVPNITDYALGRSIVFTCRVGTYRKHSASSSAFLMLLHKGKVPPLNFA